MRPAQLTPENTTAEIEKWIFIVTSMRPAQLTPENLDLDLSAGWDADRLQ